MYSKQITLGPYIKDVRPTPPPPPGRGLEKPDKTGRKAGGGVQRFRTSENEEKIRYIIAVFLASSGLIFILKSAF